VAHPCGLVFRKGGAAFRKLLCIYLSASWRIKPEALLDLANPLTPQVIQIEQLHGCAADGSQSFHFMAFESEVF